MPSSGSPEVFRGLLQKVVRGGEPQGGPGTRRFRNGGGDTGAPEHREQGTVGFRGRILLPHKLLEEAPPPSFCSGAILQTLFLGSPRLDTPTLSLSQATLGTAKA